MAFMHSAVGTGGGRKGEKVVIGKGPESKRSGLELEKGGEGAKLESKEKAIFMQTSNMG